MKKTIAAGLITVMASPVFAGSLADPVPEPVAVAPVAVVNTGGDWTGFYAGAQLGWLDANPDLVPGGDDFIYGLHAGYDYDFGLFVLGAELDYDAGDIDIAGGTASIDDVWRAKLRAGYDLGNTLIYATGGYAEVDTSIGDGDGYFGGIGVAYRVSDNFTVGGEILGHKFDSIGGVTDADATTATVRASFRF